MDALSTAGEAGVAGVAVAAWMADPADAPCERVIRGEGTSEAQWHAWPALADAPVIVLDDRLPSDRRLVVVAPHPDDEVLACGGLLFLHRSRGGSALVVAVTDGEASHPGSTHWSPAALAAERRSESAAGLARLGHGPGATSRLALSDGGVALQADALGERLAALLMPGDLVVSTWRCDGHPDHEATGAATARACAAVGCDLWEAPVWMWHWSRPGDTGVPWSRLRRLPLTAEAQAAKREALAAHATQLAPRDTGDGPVLVASLLERLARDAEFYFV